MGREDTPHGRAQLLLDEKLEEMPIEDGYSEDCVYSNPHDYAMALVDVAYVSNKVSTNSPKSIAASAYYAASIIYNRKVNQETVSELFDVGVQTIRNYYIDMVELQDSRS